MVVREGRTLGAIYRREPARILPPRGFDSTRDDPALRGQGDSAAHAAIDARAMLVGKVEVNFETDADEISPALASCIDPAGGRVRSATGELVADWRDAVLTIDTARCQGATGFLGSKGRVELRDVVFECGNTFAAVLAISLDDRPLAEAEEILLQVGLPDRPTGFSTEPLKVTWKGRDYTGHRIRSMGRMPWQVERADGRVTLKRLGGRLVSATSLDEQLRAKVAVPVNTSGADAVIPLPPEAMYVLLRLRR